MVYTYLLHRYNSQIETVKISREESQNYKGVE
jgi:hypothetical protein